MQTMPLEWVTASKTQRYWVRAYADGELVSDSIDNLLFEGYTQSDGPLTFGNVCASTISFEINNPTQNYSGKVLEVEYGIDIDGTRQFIKLGAFVCVKPTKINDKAKYTAYDNMVVKLDKPYKTNIEFPCTNIDVINDISTKSGVAINLPATFRAYTINDYDSTLTYREMLGYMVGLNGMNAFCDRDGAITVKWYENAPYTLTDDSIYESAAEVSDESNYSIQYITCHTGRYFEETEIVYVVGSGNVGIDVVNPYMSQEAIERIFSDVSSMAYRIVDTKFLGDFRLDLGDIITVETNGNTYNVPIMHLVHSCDGGLMTTVSSYGKTEEESTYNTNSPTYRELEKTSQRVNNAYNVLEKDIDATRSIIGDVEEGKTVTSMIEQLDNKFTVSIQEMQEEIDGEIEIVYVTEPPTLQNYPAWDWTAMVMNDGEDIPASVRQYDPRYSVTYVDDSKTFEYTEDSYREHRRTMAYDETNGVTYRFVFENNTWGWKVLANTEYSVVLKKLAELEVETDGIDARVEKVEVDLSNVEKTYATKSELKLESDNITAKVSQEVQGVEKQYTQLKQTVDTLDASVVKDNEVVSAINLSKEGVRIKGDKVDITGQVTFSALSEDVKNTISDASEDASDALNTANGSLKSITVYYRAWNTNSSAPTSGWTTDPSSSLAQISETNKYLWSYNEYVDANGTKSQGKKTVIGRWGDKGATGATGAKGDKGDTGAKGDKGDKGDTGAQGIKGVSVLTTKTLYRDTKTETAPNAPTTIISNNNPNSHDVWNTVIPNRDSTHYFLWTCVQTVYSDQGVVTSNVSLDFANSNIRQWCTDNNRTLINGAYLATGTVDADVLKADTTITNHITADNLDIKGGKIEIVTDTSTSDTIILNHKYGSHSHTVNISPYRLQYYQKIDDKISSYIASPVQILMSGNNHSTDIQGGIIYLNGKNAGIMIGEYFVATENKTPFLLELTSGTAKKQGGTNFTIPFPSGKTITSAPKVLPQIVNYTGSALSISHIQASTTGVQITVVNSSSSDIAFSSTGTKIVVMVDPN